MSERKPGFYWVHVYGNWEPAYTDDGDVFDHIDSRVDKVGPRIPTPDDPWQYVPVEAIKYAAEILRSNAGPLTCEATADGLESLLAAAPKPENS